MRTLQAESKRVYKLLEQKNHQAYLELGYLVYIEAFKEAQPDMAESEISKKSKKAISEKWLDKLQSEYSPVTKYVYSREVERKRARFFEAIVADAEAKLRRDMESDYRAAENAWIRQTRQATIDTEDRAAITAYRDAGVRRVRWIAQRDDKVCEECERLDGLVFSIDAVPDKPHYNCRCSLEPVKDE